MPDDMILSDDEARFLEAGGLGLDEKAQPPENEATETAVGAEVTAETAEAEAASGDDEKEAAAAGEQKPDRQRMVNHGAFHEERERRKEIEARHAKLEDRFNALLQSIAAPEPKEAQKPAAPNPDDDPLGFVRYVGEQNQATTQRLETWEQQQQQQQERHAIQSRFLTEAQAFSQTAPDFQPAYEHFHKAMVNVARMAGSQDPEADATQWQLNMVRQAAMAGQNSAELIYGLSKQYGYQGAAPAAPAAKETSGAEKLAKLDEQQRRHKSLSGGGGAAVPGALTAADVSKMSDAEFNRLLSDKVAYRAFEAALANASG